MHGDFLHFVYISPWMINALVIWSLSIGDFHLFGDMEPLDGIFIFEENWSRDWSSRYIHYIYIHIGFGEGHFGHPPPL